MLMLCGQSEPASLLLLDCRWHSRKASPCDSHSRFPDLSHLRYHFLYWLEGRFGFRMRPLRTGFEFRSSNARFLHCSFAAIFPQARKRVVQIGLRWPLRLGPNCSCGWSDFAESPRMFSGAFMDRLRAMVLPQLDVLPNAWPIAGWRALGRLAPLRSRGLCLFKR